MSDYELYVFLRVWGGSGGLVLIFVLFLIFCGYALWPANRDKFDHLARLPLDDDDAGPRL